MGLIEKISTKIARSVPLNPVRSKLTQAVASLSFDDIPFSAARVGAPLLEAHGLRGTFYVCGAHAGGSFEGRPQHERGDLVALHQAGHEIACHSFGHPNVTHLDAAQRLADTQANADFMLKTLGDVHLSSFAYPYGAVSLAAKQWYARHFLTCRGVYNGINSGVMDFSELLAIGIEQRQFDPGRVKEQIAEAKDRKGWIIFFTHDVEEAPSPYGCRPQDLEYVVTALKDAGIETLPVKAAAAKVLFG